MRFYFKLSLWLIPSSVVHHLCFMLLCTCFTTSDSFQCHLVQLLQKGYYHVHQFLFDFPPNISCTMQISLTLTTLFSKPLACLNATIIFPTNKGLTQNRREIALIQYPTISPEFSSQMYIQSSDSMPYSELIEELNGVLFVCSTLPLFFV